MNAKQLVSEAKAIIFDVDGLLIDTEPLWGKTHRAMLTKYHVQNDPAIEGKTMGMGLREAMLFFKEQLGMPGEVGELMREYRQLLYDMLSQPDAMQLMPGARKLITQVLYPKPLGIGTGGHTQEGMYRLLTTVGLKEYFSVVTSCDDVVHGKPAPDVYIYTAQQLGFSPEEIVILEDAPNGVRAGKAAGSRVIAVNAHTKWHPSLQDSGADSIIESLEELI